MREIIHWIVALFAFPPIGHPTSASDWFFTVIGFVVYLIRDLFLASLGLFFIGAVGTVMRVVVTVMREAVTRPRYWFLKIKEAIQGNWDDITRFTGTAVIGIAGFLAAVWLLAKLWPVLVWLFWFSLWAVVALVVLLVVVGIILTAAERLGLSYSFWNGFFRWTIWGTLFGIALYAAVFVGLTFQMHRFPEGFVTFLSGVPVFLVLGLVVGLIVSGIMRIVSIKILPTTLGTGALRAAILGLTIGALMLVGSDYLTLQNQRDAQGKQDKSSALAPPPNQFSIPYPGQTQAVPAATKIRSLEATSGSTTARLDYRLDPSYAMPYQRLVRLTITRRGKIALDTKLRPDTNNESLGEELDKNTLQVVDLRGDGEPEVLITAFTGGAHCCFVTTAYGYEAPLNRYTPITQDWLDQVPQMRHLGHGAALLLVGSDHSFRYRFSSFAGSGFPIRIWRYEPVKLIDVTRCYPNLIQADASRWWGLASRQHGQYGEATGVLAAYAADMYMLGEGEKAIANIQGSGMSGVDQTYLSDLESFLKAVGYENVSRNNADCH